MHSYNQFLYARERRRFGRQCLFSDRTTPMLSIQPSRRLRRLYILRNPINRGTQLSDQKAFSEMETENVTLTQHGMYHYEGGWPRDVNINDEESTMRHRKKIEREDNWGVQVNHLIRTTMDVAAQNSAVNIYQEFFEELPPELGAEIKSSFESRRFNIFHDLKTPSRKAKVLDWAPNDLNKFLIVYSAFEPVRIIRTRGSKTIDNLDGGSENAFYIWDLDNPLKPHTVFDCLEGVRRAIYCPRDENYIAGGIRSGKSVVWDSRLGGLPIRTCPLEAAHRETVSAICWVHSKSNSEFYTGSNDGSVKYWDGRDLSEPIQEILLDPEQTDEQSRERAQGVCVLEFEYTIPVRYIIATNQGHIFIGNRKGMTPTETLLANYRIFSGPIRTIERNPFFVKNFLIVGDWCAKIWAEECKGSPTTLLIKKKNEISCGTWSTARCSLFVTGDFKGELDFWDLLLHQREPIYTINFKIKITSVKFRSDGEFIAVALQNGDIHQLELDEDMKRSGHRDKPLIAALFEREQLRCKLLDGRVEEMKLKLKTTLWDAQQRALAEEQMAMLEELDPDDPDQFLQMVENDLEYKDALKQFNDLTLKWEKKRMERNFVMELTEFEIEYIDPNAMDDVPPEEAPAEQDDQRKL